MKHLIVAVAVLLTGCYQEVNQWDIERASRICGSADNIVLIEAWALGFEILECRLDGERHYINGGKDN